MRVLVTGGAGFIGSHAVDSLVADGCDVFVIDNLSSGTTANLNPQAQFFQLDITSPHIKDVCARIKPEVLIHLAAQIDVRKSVADPAEDARINILGALNTFEAARTHGCQRIIFASTGGAIYGDTEVIPTPESFLPQPLSPYGVAKLAIEHYLRSSHSVHGLNAAIARFANVYGPRQNAKGEAGVVSIFCDAILRGQTPKIYGSGGQTRDYVFVADVVRALNQLMDFTGYDIFNVGTALETDVNALARKIARALDYHGDFEHRPARPGEQQRSCLDYSKLRKRFGWSPQVDVESGIRQTTEWFKAQIKPVP